MCGGEVSLCVPLLCACLCCCFCLGEAISKTVHLRCWHGRMCQGFAKTGRKAMDRASLRKNAMSFVVPQKRTACHGQWLLGAPAAYPLYTSFLPCCSPQELCLCSLTLKCFSLLSFSSHSRFWMWSVSCRSRCVGCRWTSTGRSKSASYSVGTTLKRWQSAAVWPSPSRAARTVPLGRVHL